MRNRQPYAMQTLISQVSKRHEDASAEVSDLDGFNIYRTVVFDEATSERLEPQIDYIEADPRVASVSVDEEDNTLSITFVSGAKAESRAPFYLSRPESLQGVVQPPEGEYVEDGPDAEYEVRRDELEAMKAGDLRDRYPDHAHLPNKREIVEAILAEEFGD